MATLFCSYLHIPPPHPLFLRTLTFSCQLLCNPFYRFSFLSQGLIYRFICVYCHLPVHSICVCLSLSGQLGTNPFVSAPPAVPHSTSLLRGVAGGLGAVTPEVPLTESPGKVLPMTQEDVPPPPLICMCMFMYLGCSFTLGSLRFIPLFTGGQIWICFNAL